MTTEHVIELEDKDISGMWKLLGLPEDSGIVDTTHKIELEYESFIDIDSRGIHEIVLTPKKVRAEIKWSAYKDECTEEETAILSKHNEEPEQYTGESTLEVDLELTETWTFNMEIEKDSTSSVATKHMPYEIRIDFADKHIEIYAG